RRRRTHRAGPASARPRRGSTRPGRGRSLRSARRADRTFLHRDAGHLRLSSAARVCQGSQLLHEGQLLLFTGLLLAAGLAASLAAGRLRLPGLVLVLGLGMLIGSDGLGWIAFDDFELARQAGIVAVAMILFEGGLSSGFEEIRPVLRTSILLATLGTLATAALTGF